MQAPGETMRDQHEKRLLHMEEERRNHEPLLKRARDAFVPARGIFSGEDTKPRRVPRAMLNTTPLVAVRTASSGLHAGLTNPARPWQKSTIKNDDLGEFGPVKTWLALCDDRMMRYYVRSGLYDALPFMYAEWIALGTMCGLMFEDPETLFRVEHYTMGQYWLATDYRGRHDTFARKLKMTVRQLVSRFGNPPDGVARLSRETLDKWKRPDRREDPVEVLLFIEPSPDGGWRSYWYETANSGAPPFKVGAFDDNPILSALWEQREATDAYGSDCPGFMAHGIARALQTDEINHSAAIERNGNPPMQGPAKSVILTPGAYNPVDAAHATGQNGGIRSVYQHNFESSGYQFNIQRRQQQINEAFFVDLFLMLTMDERAQRATAEEIIRKHDEKVQILGPALQKGNEMLRRLHEFSFGLLMKRSMPYWRGAIDGEPDLPPPPKELMREGVEIVPEFISTLQQAMRASQIQGLERFATAAGTIAQITGRPSPKFNADQWLDEFGTAVGVVPTVVRSDEEVAEIAAAEAQQQQMAQMAQMAPALRDAAGAMRDAGDAVPQDGSVLQALSGALAGGQMEVAL
jgi:hypothetical protein